MATKFKQITASLVAHQENLEKLPTGAPAKDKASVDAIAADIETAIRGQVERYVERANEKDEEQRLYGPKMVAKIRELEALFNSVDDILKTKRATVESKFAQRSAEAAAEAAAAEEARVAALEEQDKLREQQRLQLARQKQRKAEEEAEAAAKAAAIAEEQSRALAAARAEKEAARAEEEAQYKAQQRRLAAEREAQEAQRMVQQKEQQAAAARAVLEARAQGSSGVLQSAGLTPGAVNEAHSLQQLNSFIETTKTTSMPCVVDFFAPWCGPCVQFAPTFQAMAAQYRDIVFVKVNCDNAAGVSASKGIRAFPTFHSYVRGALRQSWSGASLPKLQAALTDAAQAEEAAALADAVAMSTGGDAQPSPAAAASPESPRRGGTPEYSIVPGIMSERPMGLLLQSFARAVTREEFEAACKLLRAYVKNVTEPSKREDPKYRSVQSSNSAFQKRLGRHGDFAPQLMQCAGFTLQDNVWTLAMGDTTAEAAALNARPVLEAAARQAAEAGVPQVSAPARAAHAPPAPQPSAGGGGGLAGLANALGGGGGMAGLLRNPELMRVAQQMMGGGGMDPSMMARLAQNPQMAAMAQQMMQNPQAMQQAQQMMRDPQAAAQLQQMAGGGGGGSSTAPVPAAQPPAQAPAPAASTAAASTTATPAPSPPAAAAAAGAAGGSEQPASDGGLDDAVAAALSASMCGFDPDGV